MADIPESTKMKPCPFCDSENARLNSPHSGAKPFVMCGDCNAAGAQCDDPITAWNTRAAPPAMDREAVEKVREAERICRDTADRATHMLEREDRRWQPTRAHYEGLRNAVRNAERTLCALSTLSADAIRQGEGEVFTGVEAWDELVNVDDRTSPEEYPDMCLITRDELIDFMKRATPASHASDGGKADG